MDDSVTLRDVRVDEALSIAIELQKHGRLDDAAGVFRKILDVLPDHPDALHFSGVLAHQQGRSDEGVALIRRSLELAPEEADWHSNLGIVLKSLGRLEEAIGAYRRAIELDPDHYRAQNNLGVLLKAQGKPEEAEAAYREAIRLNPKFIDAWHNLGVLLSSVNRLREAVLCYCKVTTLSPKHPEARRLQAMAHCTLGEIDKAIEIFEEWVAQEPENEVARHMLASCTGRNVPTRAADVVVERLFDGFADSFDAKLTRLLYQAPQLVAAMIADSGVQASGTLDVLDAGCGTGLCGPLVAPYAKRLVGVDLSAGMLAHARERGIYHELIKAELAHYLRGQSAAFDLIVSADTLVYFGALEDVIGAAAGALRPGGALLFTVEHMQDGDEGAQYRLCTHGRYVHALPYVERLLRENGLSPHIVRADLRLEAGVPVAGLAVCARKPAADDGRAGADAAVAAAAGERHA
jgi:predicted TPR repeat methyltransferase